MPKPITIFTFVLVFVGVACGSKIDFGEWEILNDAEVKSEISWAKFIWANDSLGNRNVERTAMFIPVKIEGLPYEFQFQFDLGSDLTSLQGNTLQSILDKHPEFNRIKKYRNFIKFWKSTTTFKDLRLSFGGITATANNCSVMKNYGEQIPASELTENNPIKIGSIGADMFQNKMLVIDYPNTRFAVCDSLPVSLRTYFTRITLDKFGRVLLPLKIRNRLYRVMFDNGSSIFPLITSDDKINSISKSLNIDTITTTSWGKIHNVIGRPLKDSFSLGGHIFSNAMVYADYREEARSKDYEAITGNALFWDKTIIIDFKNKRFGVK